MGEGDNVQGDVTPVDKEDVTPEEPETLTKKEADAQIAKAVQAVKTDAGRMQKALDESTRIANAAIQRLRDREEEDYRRQEEAAKEDPDELSRIRRRRQDAERQAKLDEREAKVKTQLDKLMQVNAKALSGQYNVDAETLLKYAGDDAENMEELAKTFGEKKGEPRRMTVEPDGGKTKGAGADLTAKAVEKMSLAEQNERREEIAKIPFG